MFIISKWTRKNKNENLQEKRKWEKMVFVKVGRIGNLGFWFNFSEKETDFWERTMKEFLGRKICK